MPRRMPTGLTFWPMWLLALAVAHGHDDVAVALDDTVAAPLGARMETLQQRRSVHRDLLHLQLVHVRAEIVLGVGDRRLEHLAHQPRALLRREAQRVERQPDGLAAHEVRHQAALLRRDA